MMTLLRLSDKERKKKRKKKRRKKNPTFTHVIWCYVHPSNILVGSKAKSSFLLRTSGRGSQWLVCILKPSPEGIWWWGFLPSVLSGARKRWCLLITQSSLYEGLFCIFPYSELLLSGCSQLSLSMAPQPPQGQPHQGSCLVGRDLWVCHTLPTDALAKLKLSQGMQ